MSSYYYFAATLPGLRFDAPAPMSHAEFLERAARYLAPRDLETLRAAGLYIPGDGAAVPASAGSPLLSRYYRWERTVRNELAKLRAQRLRKQADAFVKPGEPEWEAARVAHEAFGSGDPLQAELLIERERWAYVEMLAVNRFFDMEFLCAYALQLQSLERRGRFRADTGEEGYRTVYRSVLDTADYRDESGVSK